MKMTVLVSVFLAFGATSQAFGGTEDFSVAGDAILLANFADALLIQRRPRYAFETYAAQDLIQHNPAALDGREAAIKLVSPIISGPGAHFAISALIADGGYGFIHFRGTLGGPGQGAAVAELYRIQAGKLVEHWDAFQPISEKSVSAHPMFGELTSTPPAPCTAASAADRALVTGFADLLYRQRQVQAAFERYAAPDMIQHDPGLQDGSSAAVAELTPILSRLATRITIAHILACRDMGVIHLRSQYGSAPGHVIFDIMRIAHGRIVEHWDVFQPVSANPVNPRPPL